ncbi:hypothetical protein N1027_08330 [Herbiconiux sp. CPCC 205763]|uniref:Uncharacterized protein n=1 Tax=Herbiconiux aconitum TaxID=2970913 RepID=A0ABT2GRE2_9MICO|nr:hypothetical protein [Herbiconiux aconitum]MCS5718142.1 hypothetical protein [Herbiconiux aconitum]
MTKDTVDKRITVESRVEVVSLCEGEWRICDPGLPADDTRRLVSYVSQDTEGFEVLWLATLSVQRVATLDAAIEQAQKRCTARRSDDRAARPRKR